MFSELNMHLNFPTLRRLVSSERFHSLSQLCSNYTNRKRIYCIITNLQSLRVRSNISPADIMGLLSLPPQSHAFSNKFWRCLSHLETYFEGVWGEENSHLCKWLSALQVECHNLLSLFEVFKINTNTSLSSAV